MAAVSLQRHLPRRFLLLIASCLAIAGCGHADHVPSDAGSGPSPSAARLTADEIATLLLVQAQVWQFQSIPGIHVHAVELVLVEHGQDVCTVASSQAANQLQENLLTKVIVLILPVSDGRYMFQLMAVADARARFGAQSTLTSTDSSSAVLETLLMPSDVSHQAGIEPLAYGTTALLTMRQLIQEGPNSVLPVPAADRLELRIR